jgi:hypothetical protein
MPATPGGGGSRPLNGAAVIDSAAGQFTNINGPHAGFDSNVWCDVAIAALGL